MKLDTSPEALAEELLGRPLADLDEEEQRALTRVASTDIELDQGPPGTPHRHQAAADPEPGRHDVLATRAGRGDQK